MSAPLNGFTLGARRCIVAGHPRGLARVPEQHRMQRVGVAAPQVAGTRCSRFISSRSWLYARGLLRRLQFRDKLPQACNVSASIEGRGPLDILLDHVDRGVCREGLYFAAATEQEVPRVGADGP